MAIGAPGSYALQIAEAGQKLWFFTKPVGTGFVVPNSSGFFLAKIKSVAIYSDLIVNDGFLTGNPLKMRCFLTF